MQNVAIIFFIVFCLLLLLMVFTRTVTNKIRRGFPPPGKFIDIEGCLSFIGDERVMFAGMQV